MIISKYYDGILFYFAVCFANHRERLTDSVHIHFVSVI